VEVLVDGVCCACIPVLAAARLVGLEQAHAATAAVQVPRLADTDVVVEAVRPVLGQHADGVYAAVDAVAQGEVDNAEFSGKWHGRFRPLFREDGEPRSLA